MHGSFNPSYKGSFLTRPTQENRSIASDPVPELRAALQMQSNEIARLNNGAYGFIDAPYL